MPIASKVLPTLVICEEENKIGAQGFIAYALIAYVLS
jgi:hypothetical protein